MRRASAARLAIAPHAAIPVPAPVPSASLELRLESKIVRRACISRAFRRRRRVALPRTDGIRVLSIRASDTAADPGVLFFDEKDPRSSFFELPILALDLDEPGLLKS